MTCQFKMVDCTNENCDEKVMRRDLDHHVTRECQWRSVPCPYCLDSAYICKFSQVIHVCLFVCLFVCFKLYLYHKYYCFAIFVPGKHFGIPCKDISQCYLLVCKMDRRKQFSTHALRLTGSVDS